MRRFGAFFVSWQSQYANTQGWLRLPNIKLNYKNFKKLQIVKVMAREIKFKGKQSDGIWIEGSFHHKKRKGESFWIIDFPHNEWHEVPVETVCQHVGNPYGFDIWENDIAETDSGIGNVIYFEPYASFMVELPDGTLANIERIRKILGNVFDNPDLLTKTE